MGSYLSAMWRCRYFWLSLVRMDLRARYRRSVLGMGWSLLQPLIMASVLCYVFHRLFRVEITEFGPYLLSGLACWNFITTTTVTGCQCFFIGEPYIRQYPAPLAIYPLRTALAGLFHFLITMVLVVGFSWYFRGFGGVPALVSLIPALVLLFLFSWSLAVLAGFANVFFRDTQHLCDVGFQILFYATPIIYPPQLLRDNGLQGLMSYNPIVAFLQLVREPLLDHQAASGATFALAAATTLVALAAATATLARGQRRLIFHL